MSYVSKISWLVVILILSPFLLYGFSQFIPGMGGFVVQSGSMEPEIQTGSLLFTYTATAENIGVGDTITYQDGESFVTHEVIQKNSTDGEYTFITQGIANNAPDLDPVSEDQIAGKKLFSIPYLGYVVGLAGTATGKIVLVLIPATLIIGNELWQIKREIRN